MEKEQVFQRNAGFFVSFLSGVCTISSGAVVSILQGTYSFAYGVTGTLLPLMSIDNLLAGFAPGMLPVKIGTKKTVVLLTAGYGAGYMIMGFSGWMLVLMSGFFMVGVIKGSTINTCTVLVADNSGDRTKGTNIMYDCYALGALLCPFSIAAAMKAGGTVPMLVLTVCGFLLWLTLHATPAEAKVMKEDWNIDKSFLKSRKFWVLTGLLFCQNAAETSVTGWMVIYFKGNGIILGSLSSCIIVVVWGATLIARLLIAFVIPTKNSYSAMTRVGIGYVILCMGLMMASTQITAIPLLLVSAFAMAGMNLTAVANVDRMTSAASMGIMPLAASSGTIIMLWTIGIVSGYTGIEIGIASNIIPCASMLLLSVAVRWLEE